MAQTTNYEIANSSGLVFRGRVNEVFAAVQSNNSGSTAPTGTVAYQLWYDTTTNILKMRDSANSAWISLFTVDQTNGVWSVNANSTSNALRITQTGTGNALLVEDSANPDSTPFVITGAGDVGIGTTTPTNTLTVNGTIGGTIVATQAEAETGTDATKLITPLGVRNALRATGSAPVYACRAWVNFNGVGTVTIRASGNVSSITDNGVGLYTVNFTTALQDVNYATAQSHASTAGSVVLTTYATTSLAVETYNNSATLTDRSVVCVSVFR